jgi:hypothetical protein
LALAASVMIGTTAIAQNPLNADGTPQTASQFIAARIYRALVGHDPEPGVLAQAAADIDQGRLRQRVNAIVISAEFRGHMHGLPPDGVLAEIYRGLLEHDPDAGAANWQRMISMSRYADVIAGIIATPEFKEKIAGLAVSDSATTSPGLPPVSGMVSPAITCQDNVVEAIRRDLGGVVFLQFDAPVASGAAITGAAIDVNAGGRRLTYTCNPTATYRYDDGARGRSGAAAEFANDVVRACQTEIRMKALQQFAAVRLTFQSAGLMAGGTSSHVVRGMASEAMPSAATASTFKYSCDMDGTQVTASSVHAG